MRHIEASAPISSNEIAACDADAASAIRQRGNIIGDARGRLREYRSRGRGAAVARRRAKPTSRRKPAHRRGRSMSMTHGPRDAAR